MIRLENTKVIGFEDAIRGMRNPMNSLENSDSEIIFESANDSPGGKYVIGENDLDLMMRLVKGGPVHAKFRRMIVVYVDITAPLYWWKEFDTYKVGTVANSCSTMHKIHAKEFEIDDFSHEHLYSDELELLKEVVSSLNSCRELYLDSKKKGDWWQMIQLLPSSYNQKRTIMLNYEVLAGIYPMRKDHKLDEWHIFCEWIEKLPYSEVILGEKVDDIDKKMKKMDLLVENSGEHAQKSDKENNKTDNSKINITPVCEEIKSINDLFYHITRIGNAVYGKDCGHIVSERLGKIGVNSLRDFCKISIKELIRSSGFVHDTKARITLCVAKRSIFEGHEDKVYITYFANSNDVRTYGLGEYTEKACEENDVDDLFKDVKGVEIKEFYEVLRFVKQLSKEIYGRDWYRWYCKIGRKMKLVCDDSIEKFVKYSPKMLLKDCGFGSKTKAYKVISTAKSNIFEYDGRYFLKIGQ